MHKLLHFSASKTGHPVLRPYLFYLGGFGPAFIYSKLTPGIERAPRGQSYQVGRQAGYYAQLALAGQVQPRHRA